MNTKPRRSSAQQLLEVAHFAGGPKPRPIDAPIAFHQAAVRIGIGAEKLRELVNRGEAPAFVKIDGKRMFLPSTIEKWIKARERQSLAVLRKNKALVAKFSGVGKDASESERRSRSSRSTSEAKPIAPKPRTTGRPLVCGPQVKPIRNIVRAGAAPQSDPKSLEKSWDNAFAKQPERKVKAARRPAAPADASGWDAALQKASGTTKRSTR